MVILWSNGHFMVKCRGESDHDKNHSWRGFAGFMVIWSFYYLLKYMRFMMYVYVHGYDVCMYVCMYIYKGKEAEKNDHMTIASVSAYSAVTYPWSPFDHQMTMK